MFCKVNLFYALVLCSILNITLAADDCRTCMTNSVWCVNDSSYYVCADGKNPSNKLITCPKDTFCTNSPNKVCLKKSEITATAKQVCKSQCGICPDRSEVHKRFTCVSRTQFDMCDANGKGTNQYSTCDDGLICNAGSYQSDGKICVPKCVTDFYKFSDTCANDVIVTTTEAPAPTVPTATLVEKCEATGISSKEPFYLENMDDKSCRTYIVCQNFGTATEKDFDAAILTCKNGGYFNIANKACGAVAPSGCPRTETPQPTVPIENTTENPLETTTENLQQTETTTDDPQQTETTTVDPNGFIV